MSKIKLSLLIVSIVLYVFSLVLTLVDPKFNYSWVVFGLYLLSVFLVSLIYVHNHSFNLHFTRYQIIPILIVLFASIVLGLSFLGTYPFIGVQDELRDSGLNAQRIVNGNIKNFFAYGNYNGFGMIIPTLSSFFYRIFGPSVLAYRIPSLIIYCFENIFLFILIKKLTNTNSALLGALIFASLPLHLFIARTELVVGFDSFWAIVALLVTYNYFKNHTLTNLIGCALVLGIASQFHTAARVFSVLLIIPIILTEFKSARRFVVMAIFFLVGFGPMLLMGNIANFSDSGKLYYTQADLFKPSTYTSLKDRYLKSLMVLIYEPANSRFPVPRPLLPFELIPLFFWGLSLAVVDDRKFLKLLIIMLLLIPFTFSAITNTLNLDYRLVPMSTIAVILISLSIHKLLKYHPSAKYLVNISLGSYLFYIGLSFFTSQIANQKYDTGQFVIQHSVYAIKNTQSLSDSKTVCLTSSSNNVSKLDLMHHKEQLQYFLPQTKVVVTSSDLIKDNQMKITSGDCSLNNQVPTQPHIISCTGDINFTCPVGLRQDIILYY